MRELSNFVVVVMAFVLVFVSVCSSESIDGTILINGFHSGGDSGVLLLEGNVQGCEILNIYSSSETLLLSLGSMAMDSGHGVHVFCDLEDFSVQIPMKKDYLSGALRIDAVTKRAKVSVKSLGQWYWTVDGDFEIEMSFGGKVTGCFTAGICGNGIKIYGPYCDPCEYVLCCYGQVGFIECGSQLCR